MAAAHYIRFSPSEDEAIRALYGVDNETLARRLHKRSEASIRARAQKLGIVRKKAKPVALAAEEPKVSRKRTCKHYAERKPRGPKVEVDGLHGPRQVATSTPFPVSVAARRLAVFDKVVARVVLERDLGLAAGELRVGNFSL